MSRLAPAHRGYEYQDLLVACRFVDILLGNITEALCDQKQFKGDRFDDVTTTNVNGKRERVQFKHRENDGSPTSLETFISDRRGLQLDQLFRSMLADRDGPGNHATDTIFRVLLVDKFPTDPRLTAVMAPLTTDPGPYLTAMRTTRYGFVAEALWKQNDSTTNAPFYFLFHNQIPFSYGDLKWCCDRLVLEFGAPRASFDLTKPYIAEQLLLTRVRDEVGAEAFPNTGRRVVDVAAALVSAARAGRQGLFVPTADELLRRAQLRSDFGAVSRSHPVDVALEVRRPSTVEQLVNTAYERAAAGGYLLVQGPPGHGKSWVCQQLLDTLWEEGWLVAEHYCYLGDADGERLERVLIEAVYGSLLGRLSETDPRVVKDHRPRFAADEEALVTCLRHSIELEPSRKIALVIDGIDHITRVRSRVGAAFDPSRSMSEALASLDLPPGTVVIVLSQPGIHLEPLIEADATVTTLEGLSQNELRLLANRLGVFPLEEKSADSITPHRFDDTATIAAFLDALGQRSGGNALYATYLCREVLRSIDTCTDPARLVLQLPQFDGTLKNYYSYLYLSLNDGAKWVADVIALLDFSISRSDLREIMPEAAHRIDDALLHLGPVLVERATQGGIRVYHESFARYLRIPYQDDPKNLAALLKKIISWLEQKGFYVDFRAFQSLLRMLAEAGDDARVVEIADGKFVTRAVASGFPASAINRNLATAIGAAKRLGEWPLIIRYVELSRAVDSYQSERFDSTLVSFAEVPAALLGVKTVADRLLEEDRLVMPARDGLQMCAALDKLGATVPWKTYIDGYERESESDNTSYGEASDRAVALALLRGRLRLAANNRPIGNGVSAETSRQINSTESVPIDWLRFAQWVDQCGLPARNVLRAVLDTHGWEGAMRLLSTLERSASICLALADELVTNPALAPYMCSPQRWAAAAVASDLPSGTFLRILAHGVDPDILAADEIAISRVHLLDLTRRVQESSVRWDKGQVGPWVDACVLAAFRDPIGLATTEALIIGDGWYPCWLRFVVAISRVVAARSVDQGHLALNALRILTDDLRPFAGVPRSCDLYQLHPIIAETIESAMRFLNDVQWGESLNILNKVSSAIGFNSGPVSSELVLRLAVEGASLTRRISAELVIADVIAKKSGHRIYSEVAEYKLFAARLAVKLGDYTAAATFWQEACVLLVGYGWRKDRTIYEVLDPLEALIKVAPQLVRLRLASVQSLCKRVMNHTDGKETRHAMSHWWSLVAKADPVTAVQMAAPKLLVECNDPNWLLHDALEYVWREWRHQVDPLVAGSLRLSLDTPLDPTDYKQLESLSYINVASARRLLIWLLGRTDERPVSYSVSNSAELVARDDQRVAELNVIANNANVPCVFAIREESPSNASNDQSNSHDAALSPPQRESNVPAAILGFPIGLVGLVRAIRAWRNRPYDTTAAQWETQRFANVIGYRMLCLLKDGRHEDLRSNLRSLADGVGYSDRAGILRMIAEGLERHGEMDFAAITYSLAWTRTRGGGGWLTFGGETEIESLHRATALASGVTNAVVAEEVERIVANANGTLGISQAIIHALAVGAISTHDESSKDIAFRGWDEAFNVIDARAPKVDDSDDPDMPYCLPTLDQCDSAPGDVESAFALASFAGLAHPGREKKRRSFLAAQLLLEERPQVCARVLPIALSKISDPATLTWLLSLFESSGHQAISTPKACQDVFREMTTRSHLTVRALARRLITGEPPPLATSTPPNKSVVEIPGTVWRPGHTANSYIEASRHDRLLNLVAGRRIRSGERSFDGLGDAVRSRAASVLNSDELEERLDSQLEALSSRGNERWPDAFLAREEAIEDILQTVASTGRATLLMAGEPVLNPVQWEDELADDILDDPRLPLMLEACRQPRPPLPAPPGDKSGAWTNIREHASGCFTKSIVAGIEKEGLLQATLTLESVRELPTVNHGPFRDWYWIGTYERRVVRPRDYDNKSDLVARRYRILEVRDINDRQALTLPPVIDGDLRFWQAEISPTSISRSALNSTQPIIGIDYALRWIGDGHSGLGVDGSLLVPTASLIGLLQLRIGAPFTYEDASGVGLALVTWRTEYQVSDYYMAWPRTVGCGIVIRPDLLKVLVSIAGEQRLVMRDFVLGDSKLGSSQ